MFVASIAYVNPPVFHQVFHMENVKKIKIYLLASAITFKSGVYFSYILFRGGKGLILENLKLLGV